MVQHSSVDKDISASACRAPPLAPTPPLGASLRLPAPAHPGTLARTLGRQPAGVAQHFPVQGGLCAPLGCVLLHQFRELCVDRLQEAGVDWAKNMQPVHLTRPSLMLCFSATPWSLWAGSTGT